MAKNMTAALPGADIRDSIRDVIASPSRVRRMRTWRHVASLCLMVLALLCAVTAIGWHDALPHHDEAGETGVVVSASQAHDDAGDGPDSADPLHMAVHAVAHGIAVPVTSLFVLAIGYTPLLWTEMRQQAVSSIPPGSILRPPRG